MLTRMLYSQLENEKLENYALVTIARDLRLSNLFALEKHHVQEFQPPSSLLVLGHCKFDFQENCSPNYTSLLHSLHCFRAKAQSRDAAVDSWPPNSATLEDLLHPMLLQKPLPRSEAGLQDPPGACFV